MDINTLIAEFTDKQKLNGASDEEIQETLIIATNAAISGTKTELESVGLSDKAKEILAKIQQDPREMANSLTADEFLTEKVNETETIADVFARHFKSFLDQL